MRLEQNMVDVRKKSQLLLEPHCSHTPLGLRTLQLTIRLLLKVRRGVEMDRQVTMPARGGGRRNLRSTAGSTVSETGECCNGYACLSVGLSVQRVAAATTTATLGF